MTTARVIVTVACRDIGLIGPADALEADDASFGLDKLNALLDEWQADSQFAYARAEVVGNVSGATSTIGTSQTFNTSRPVRIEGGYTRFGTTDYPFSVITQQEYGGIPDKDTSGSWPQYVYYDSTAPTGLLYWWPVPVATVEGHVFVLTAVGEFVTLDTDLSLAQGYRSALQSTLAERLCDAYQRPVSAQVAKQAKAARDRIGRTNAANNVPQLRSRTGVSRLSGIYGDIW